MKIASDPEKNCIPPMMRPLQNVAAFCRGLYILTIFYQGRF